MLSIGLVLLVIGTVAVIYVYKKMMNLPAKSKCKLDAQCASGACARATAADGAQLECCAGEKTNYSGYDYCKNMPNGSVCWSDAMCANEICEGNVYGVKKGHCSGHLAVGSPCDSNKECENKACGRETAADGAPTSCCKSGSITNYLGFDYCKEMPNGSKCWSDAMCAGKYCQDNNGGFQKGVCRGHLKVGEACDSNAQCLNEACARETAADGAPKTCCKSGKITNYLGYDYCKDMPNGSVCWSDAQCAKGYCQGNAGGFKKGLCRGDLPADASCVENRQCHGGACGRESAADGAPLQCCPSGGFLTYGGFDYCSKMREGAVCWSDAQCANNYCEGNAGGTKKGHCRGNLPVNATCESNRQCLNTACGRESAAADSRLQCCPSGAIGHYLGFDYCTSMPEGSVCWSDAQCANNYCEGNAGGVQRGRCRGNLPVDATCESNRQCLNTACGRKSAADGAPLQCCPSGAIGTYGGFDYCTSMPEGAACHSDAQCANQFCEGNASGFAKGVCRGKLGAYQPCVLDRQCANGNCGSNGIGTGNYCCAYGQHNHFGEYCTGLGVGSVCKWDAQCNTPSGNCKGNGYGVKNGHCV